MNHNIRSQLFCAYLDELQTIKGQPLLSQEKKQANFIDIECDPYTQWIDIYGGVTEKELIGFLLVGTAPNCHPAADFYIEEAYILPSHRRQKYMSQTATDFMRANPGTYCLFIINTNNVAKNFWFNLFAKNGYIPCSLSDVGAGDEYCTQYGFRPL